MSWSTAKSSETSGKWVSFSGCVCWFQGQLCRIALSVSEMSMKSCKYIKSHTNNLTFSYYIGQGSPEKQNICASMWFLTLCNPVDCNTPRPPCPSATPGVYSDSCPSSQWCHPAVSSSVLPCSSHLQSFPASGSFPVSQFFASGGQSIGASAAAPVLPVNTQGSFPSGWTGGISVQSKGLSRVFSNTTVQKHPFFGAQSSLWSICDYWKNHKSLAIWTFVNKVMSPLFDRLLVSL